jgi:glycerol-3-phosphate acyltransferase PlsY
MDPIIAVVAAAAGYLFGSISFARLIARLVAPQLDLSDGVEMNIPGGKEPVRLDAIAGTAVAVRLGDRYGCLTALLDMIKVAAPTLAFRLAYPGTPDFLITATMGVVGHNWPLYHRFKGGRGLSAIYGGFLVIDPIGTLITSLASLVLGLLARNVLVAYSSGIWLMIPWIWFRTGDPAYLVYVVAVNVIYMVAIIPDIRRMRDQRRRGVQAGFDETMEIIPMGRVLRKLATRLGSSQDSQKQSC